MNDMINGMPQIQRQPRQQAGAGDMTNFLSLQMMVNRELQSTQRLHQDLSQLVRSLEKLIDKNDTPGFTEKVASTIEAMATRLENPIINMEFPTDELVNVKKAIQALKFESKDNVSVSNIGEVVRVINELKPFLVNLESAIEDGKKDGPDDVVLDKESKGYLKNLENLDTSAKNPIAVRLSDGKEFYKSIGSLDTGIRAMTGSSGNNFLTPTGNPTKANVDGNNNLKVSQDNYTVKIEYSGSNPIYIGKTIPGNASSVATWQIQKLTYSGSNVTDVQWASGSLNFTHIWDSRTGYTYS